jgi:diguanylate cyclase (GGDEF)-like protein
LNFSNIKYSLWRWLQNLSSIQKTLLVLAIYLTVGFALKQAANLLNTSLNVQPWNPAAGWNVLLLLCFGLRYAPVIFFVPFFHGLIDIFAKNQPNNLIKSVTLGASSAIVYSITAALFKYKLDFNPKLRRQKDIFQFVIYWTVAALIVAVSSFAMLLVTKIISPSDWIFKAMQEWAGQATGITMLSIPLLILLRPFSWSDHHLTVAAEVPEIDFNWLKKSQLWWSWAGFILVALVFTVLAYGTINAPGLEYTYFAFIPLTLVAAWKGFEQATLMVVIINLIAVTLIYFQPSSINGSALQFGLMTLTYVGVFLGAITTSHQQESYKRQQAEEELRYDATHDSLTRLYNRAWLIDRLRQTIKRTQTETNYCFAVLFLDLDRFKSVNDSLGHVVGDRLLTAVAQRLTSCSPDPKMVVRLGGDEFVVLLEEIADIEQVTLAARTIAQELSQVYTIDTHEIYTSTSIGITYSEFNYQQPEDILRDADIALYQAKARGKSQYALFDRQMYNQVVRRSQLENDLRRAVQQLN